MQVMDEHGEEIDATALAAMPYADATVKEGLRKSIIVPSVNRVALKTFEMGQYTIPKARAASPTGCGAHAMSSSRLCSCSP